MKTSGAKGIHVFVPVDPDTTSLRLPPPPARWPSGPRGSTPIVATTEFVRDARGGSVFVDSTRVGGATVVAAYSPRVRPGSPVSFPVAWDDLDDVAPADFTVHNVLELLGDTDPWAEMMPAPQVLAADARRGGPRDPRRPRAGDARGQAARPCPAGRPGLKPGRATGRRLSRRPVLATPKGQTTRTFWASSPLRPGATSNSTRWPSSRDL